MPEQQVSMGFWDHIAEFGKRMKIVLATFLVSLFIMLILPANSDFFALTNNYEPIMSVFLKYVKTMTIGADVKFIAVSISDPITLYVYAAFVFAVGITLPIFAYQAYKFIDPALYPHERKAVFPFVSIVSVLFVSGCIFGFFFLFPSFIQGFFPFFQAVGAEMLIPIMDFYNMLFFTILISGVLFTVPAFFVLLVKFNVIKTKMFAKKRKWIYLGLVAAAMLISPGATPQGDLILFISLALLFEISMFAAKKYERKNSYAGSEQPTLMKFFSNSGPVCRYCNAETDGTSKFCPKCKRLIN
jgi:sec-independent protein translocase protein TatC